VRAAGLTPQQFQDEVARIVDERVMRSPMVNVLVEEGSGFVYTVYGAVGATGIFTLPSADHRLLDALAQAGGVPLMTERVYVIRDVPLTEDVIFDPTRGTRKPGQGPPGEQPTDIEDLIRQLEQPQRPPPPPAEVEEPVAPREQPAPQRPPIDIEELLEELEEPPATSPDRPPVDVDDLTEEPQDQPGGHAAPGLLAYQEGGPTIDIEELEPIQVPPSPGRQPPGGERPQFSPQPRADEETYIYVPERDEWVPARAEPPPEPAAEAEPETEPEADLFVARIIEIPYQRLKRGESSYNIVIRPKDRVYVAEPTTGVIYIDGEVARPGVYSLPASGRITLSRLVTAAGGLGPLAIPERVDLTRIVGTNREANIRLDLGAIRKKTEPDLYLKPDDHIIIGTDFWAVPLAVFRNGLRMTYGFGFLLDRNFGNDVFGAPPSRVRGN
jgi:protein involved in polysaccharide export with SLBB domain